MTLTVRRETPIQGRTFGVLSLNGVPFCQTLEDQLREIPGVQVADWKVHGQTAIPAGRYPLVLSFSQRFQTVLPEVLDVPGFAGIRIHSGNVIDDTDGCLLVGMGRSGLWVTRSRQALAELLDRLRTAPPPHAIEYRNPPAWAGSAPSVVA
jgi:hypothetical protein